MGQSMSAAVGTYDIVPFGAAGTGLSNYTITYVNGTLSVTPALLTVTAKSGRVFRSARVVSPTRWTEPTGRRIAVVGAGPAGLSCAHRLALLGHDVTIYESRKKSGGLNEYGIAAYKTVNGKTEARVEASAFPGAYVALECRE